MGKILFVSGILLLLITTSVFSCCGCDEKKHETKVEKSAAEDLKDQTVCPVIKAPINRDLYVDYRGVRVFFCCEGCVSEFKKDPERYLKALKDLGEKPLKLE